MRREKASVLVGMLWCLALLAVVVVGLLHSARLDLLVVKNYGDQVQAHYLALAGIEKAKAVIWRDIAERKKSALNHSGAIYDAPDVFRGVRLGRGEFSIFRQGRRDEGQAIVYGVADEESRLNLNLASPEELSKLYNITPEVVAAIQDWRDGDNSPRPGGAEAEYYMSLPSPYLPRNGRFQTVRELLMVMGVQRDLFFGEDANGNGLLDPEEDDGDESFPPDNHDGILDAGWSGDLTVDSWVANKNAAGEDRTDIKTADENALSSVPGISGDLAKAIVAYRGQNQFETVADLLEVAPVAPRSQAAANQQGANQPPANQPPANQPPANASGSGPPGGGSSGGKTTSSQSGPNAQQPTGPKLISEELLLEIADDLTTISGAEQPGAVNINTASVDVLICLPGVTPELAQAIVSYRKSAGFFRNVAYLLRVDGMTRPILKQILPRISVRSETFRITSEGTVTSTGARKRIQAIVRLSAGNLNTIGWREDL